MGFYEKVAEIRKGVLEQPQYRIPVNELVERACINNEKNKVKDIDRNLEEKGL